MLIQAAREGLNAPVNLTWEITLKCNLRCAHCLSEAGKPMEGELTTKQCMDVIDELARLKVFQINIGGGEPFSRSDLFEILEYAKTNQIVACVSTNGTMLTGEACKKLSELDNLYLQVSLDGYDADTNDKIRGKGTHSKVINCLESLSKHGVKFSVNTVLTRHSFYQLEDLKALAARYGAYLRVSRFRPSGRGKKVWADLAPDKKQLESFALWLERDSAVLTGDSFFSLSSERRRRMGLDLCGAAKMTACLAPDGAMYPCAFLQDQEFLSGNIKSSTLQDIWNTSPIFLSFRQLEVKSCESCFRFETCRGGCPAVAYHTYQDLSFHDPECLRCIKGAAN